MTERTEPVELTGLTILLERMKTHPEEFVKEYSGDSPWRSGRWDNIINNASSFMTEDEFFKLEQGLRDCARTMFNGKVLEVLAGQVNQEERVDMPASGILNQNALSELTRQNNNAIRKMIDNAPVEVQRNRSRMI